jgi:hypothetical protein
LLKQPWSKAEDVLSATLVARCGGVRFHLIAERLPVNDGWDRTVWRQDDEPEASRHGYAPGAITAMATAEGAARHLEARAVSARRSAALRTAWQSVAASCRHHHGRGPHAVPACGPDLVGARDRQCFSWVSRARCAVPNSSGLGVAGMATDLCRSHQAL